MIPTLEFGRTGHRSTRIIFGAAAFWAVSQSDADRVLDLLLQYGINHIDTAASYGESELRIGPWMDRYRSQFFLATKTGQRTYQGAKDEFHRSLDRLRVSSVDLIQLHYLVDPQEWEVAMGPGGALAAVIEAREQGLVRFIGVTGHDLTIAAMHQRSLERFDFDTVLLPYNYTIMKNPQYATDFETLLTTCQQRNLGVQTIKSLARGAWGDRHKDASTWYEPISEQAGIDKAVHWILGRPGIFLNSVGDITILPKVLDAANRFEARPSDAEMEQFEREYGLTQLFTH